MPFISYGALKKSESIVKSPLNEEAYGATLAGCQRKIYACLKGKSLL